MTHIETDPNTFTPSNEIVSLNALASNRAKTTHVDLTYPFCEPSTKDNSSLEFYHLLLTGEFSPAKTQVFTVLTVQEPGEFLKNARQDTELGHLLVNVYRSWGFTQKDTIEQFMSDDGVPYWYLIIVIIIFPLTTFLLFLLLKSLMFYYFIGIIAERDKPFGKDLIMKRRKYFL